MAFALFLDRLPLSSWIPPHALHAAPRWAALLPILDADLWLFSNLSSFQDRPFRISLSEGVACRNVASLPNPKLNRPLLGMRALRRAGLRVTLDFTADTVSVWIPCAWYLAPLYALRRTLASRVPDSSLWVADTA